MVWMLLYVYAPAICTYEYIVGHWSSLETDCVGCRSRYYTVVPVSSMAVDPVVVPISLWESCVVIVQGGPDESMYSLSIYLLYVLSFGYDTIISFQILISLSQIIYYGFFSLNLWPRPFPNSYLQDHFYERNIPRVSYSSLGRQLPFSSEFAELQ
jgi:hypothetical protein